METDCQAILNWDPAHLNWIAAHLQRNWLTPIMKGISILGKGSVLIIFLLGSYFLFDDKRKWRFLVATFIASAILNLALKHSFMTCRPHALLHLTAETGYAFPSGHAQGAAVVWIGLAYYLKNLTLRIICTFIAILICFSRLYLGVHSPIDVIAGFLIGICILLISIYLEKRTKHPSSQPSS